MKKYENVGETNMKKNMSYIHFAIGLLIMIAFRFIPVGVLPEVTEVGLQIMGIFIGTIYLWTTSDPTVASLTAVVMIGLSDFTTAGGALVAFLGNATVGQMIFLMIFMGGLTNRKLTAYIGRWILTRKVIEGRPWVFTTAIILGSYVMSVFIGCFAPIFLFWPVLYGIFEDVGFKKTDKYPKLIVIGVVLGALIGFPVPPYMSNGLALLGNYRGLLPNFGNLAEMEGVMISDASYFIGCFVMGLILAISVVLVMRFVFRPDVEPLKDVTIEMLEKNPLPPMNKGQKIFGISLVVFIFCMLVPSLLPNVPVLSFLNKNSLIVPMILTVILALIQVDDGPVLNIQQVMGKDFAWPTFWLCAAAIYLGGVLTNESTGITPFLSTVLSPIFTGMSGTVFTIVLLIVTVVLTNICNSLVIGMIMQPVVLTYCVSAGVNPAPIITLLIFTVLLSAACTPAASPFAAMLFGNKEYLTSGDVYKYSTTFVLVEVVIILVLGIPFINLLM